MDNDQIDREMDEAGDDGYSLTCYGCDAGYECLSEADAIAQGWIDIVPAFYLIEANYLGLCPDCQKDDD